MRYTCIFIITFLSFGYHGNAQEPGKTGTEKNAFSGDIFFSHLTEKDGLSSHLISAMLKDRDGYLWIGTQNGLNRFDGKRFEVFQRQKGDTTTILQNVITSLDMDPSGNIWCGTEDGIVCYNKKSKKFFSYVFDDKNVYPRANYLVSDNKGKIWAGTESGLVRLDPETRAFTYYKHDTLNVNSLPDNRIYKNGILPDSEKKGLWIATQKGLCFFDVTSGKVINYRNAKGSQLFNDHAISALHKNKEGIIWYFDNQTKELVAFNPHTEAIIHTIPLDGIMKTPYGGFIFETSYKQLWYSSNSYETMRIDYQSGKKPELVKNDLTNPTSILGDYIACAVEDSDQTVWLGTIAGLSRFNHKRLFYSTNKTSRIFPAFNENWYITCIAQHPDTEEWWVGTRDDKVYIFNPVTNTWSVVDFAAFPKAKNAKYITDIDFVNHLAVICYGSAPTYQYDRRKNTLTGFTALQGEFANYPVRVIVQETDSTYIFGNNLPILRWNKSGNTLQPLRFEKSKDERGNNFAAGWLCGKKNKGTWLSLSNQDVGFLLPGDSIIYPFSLPLGRNVHKGGYFNGMSVDDFGQPWISYTAQGIYHLRKKRTKMETNDDVDIKSWSISDGLINETIFSTISDHHGNIWCASLNKFSVFDPVKNQFYNFKIQMSENNSFYYNYMITLKNGNVLTNIRGDLIEFNPSFLNILRPQNPVIISSLSLPDRKILLDGETEISLQPDENFITIGFGSLSVPEYVDYHLEYMLEGVNDKWTAADGESEAVYTNLPPGKYTFRLRAVSQDGKWDSGVKTLRIHIRAPFYKTWWFLSFAFVLFSFLVFVTVRYRIRNIRNINNLKSKTQLLEKEKTTVMYENLKQHLNPHFLFNSLTSLSSLIRLDPKKALDFLDKMSKVYRYILRNKDNETVPLIEELNFVGMYIQLQKTRFEDGLVIKENIPEEVHHRRIVPVTLQNLIENAIKHNTADPESPLVIELFVEDDYLVVRNVLQKKNFVETSNKQGQQSMVSLYRFLSSTPLIIDESGGYYTVKIPLI